jgi:RHS repeat-associated protein
LNTGGTVVKQHSYATYLAAPQHWDRYQHTYEHARADMRGRGWLGFAKHTVTRTMDGTTTTTEFDNTTTDGGTSGVPVVYPYARVPEKTTTLVVGLPAGTGHTGTRERRHTVIVDNDIRRFGSRYTVEPEVVVDIEEERLASAASWQTLRGTTTTTVFDAYGNADHKVTATTGGRTTTEDPHFSNDETAWLIGFPDTISTKSCSPDGRCTTRVVTQQPYPNGNLKETIVEPQDPKLKLTTTLMYGNFGTVTSVTEAAASGPARVTRFEYDADMLYPSVTINAAGHRSTVATQPGLSLPIAVTGPNGAGVEKITMRYDRFGRPRELYRGDGSSEIITHGSFLGAQLVTKRLSGGAHSTSITDWFDREYEREVRAFDGRNATTYTSYDAFGRVSTVSRPTLPGETRHNTVIAYDRLDRPIQVTEPDGTTRHEYIGREKHLYDAKGVHSYLVANPDGDVVSSFEDDPIAAPWLHTRFEYGPFGLPSKITAPDDTVQSMLYDTLGNRTDMADSVGTTKTSYSAFGEVLTETDAAGVTATYTHDALSRVTRVTSPDGPATNTWDTAANGIGKLASSDSPDGVFTRYQYNELSQHTSTSWKIGAETFQFVSDYDEFGRQATTTYPHVFTPEGYERLKVRYGYNASGYLSEIRDTAAPPGAPAIWTAEARNGAAQLTRERMGNGALTTNEYSPAGLLSRTFTDGPGTVGRLADISYSRDPNRNVTGRQDAVNSRTENYGYDTLNRLTSWRLRHGATDTTTAYTYDKAGNLKTETAPGVSRTYHHGENGAPPHALTGMGDDHQRFTYDDAGRQLTAPRRTITYNRAGLPKTLTYGQNQLLREFDYDASGARVRRTDPGSSITHITVGGLYERRIPPADDTPVQVGVEHVHNISVDGRIVAQVTKRQDSPGGAITASGLHFLHTDAQGSVVRVSSRNGSPRTDFFYDPWGQRITDAGQPTSRNEGAPRHGYTHHEHDDNYGLINMRGRMYDPETRRFLTTDPVISDPAHGQSLNRYSYVRNNPATLTDPTGLDPAEGSSVCTLECPGMGPWKDLNPLTLVIDPNGQPQEAGDQGATKSDGDTATDKGKADPASPNTPTCEDCAGSGEAVQVGDPAIADYYEQVAYSGAVDREAASNLVQMANGIRDGSVEAPSETIMIVGADRSVLEKRESFGRSMAALEMAMGFIVEQACGAVTACDLIMTAIDIYENGFDPLTHTFNLLPLVKRPKFKGTNTTSKGFKRANATEWRKIRDSWDEAGFGDALSEANRKKIARGRAPVVDDAWIEYFPGDAKFKGELISIHHIHGWPFTVPQTKSRHKDAHMPGGYGKNTGGPGTSG